MFEWNLKIKGHNLNQNIHIVTFKWNKNKGYKIKMFQTTDENWKRGVVREVSNKICKVFQVNH